MEAWKRVIVRCVYAVRLAWWFFTRPHVHGVVVLIRHKDTFLCIRNTYGGRYWMLPGGGIKRHETPKEAALREVYEEVGITLSDVTYLGHYQSTRLYARDTVECYCAEVRDARVRVDEVEVFCAQWFDAEDMPPARSCEIEEPLALYRRHLAKMGDVSRGAR